MEQATSNSRIAIGWTNLNYYVPHIFGFGSSKQILRQLNGHFNYQSLNGLMGPSGAGKTTLLNCLSANQLSGLSSESHIFVNPPDSSSSLVQSCFIDQHVHQSIVGKLTVRHIFRYAFKFKNGLSHSKSAIDKHIGDTMKELMLPSGLLDRKYEQCSGGEQKRIAIGQELMSLFKPALMYIEEPTTGLDSSAAFEMISCLKKLTINHNICIITSIHQPNSDTLALFDNLYVLAKGGVCIYAGPPNKIKENLEANVRFSKDHPPIETLLKIACDGLASQTISQLASSTIQSVTHNHTHHPSHQSISILHHRKPFSFTDLAIQLTRHFRITFIANIRTVLFFAFLYAVNYALVATVFSATSKEAGCVSVLQDANTTSVCSLTFEEEIEFKENAFNLCYTVLYVGLVMIYSSTAVFASNVKFFRNEHRNHWYSLNVFYWSSVFINILELTIFGLLISSLAYFVTSQHAADNYSINLNRFGHFTFFIWILCVYITGIGQLIGVLLMDYYDLAAIVSIIYYLCISMLNGFFVNTDISGNPLIITGTNLVALKFISHGLVYSIYGIDRCDIDTEDSVVLQFLNVNLNTIWSDFFWIGLNMTTFRLATFGLMYFKFGTYSWPSKKNYKFVDQFAKQIAINLEIPVQNGSEYDQNGNPKSEPRLEFKFKSNLRNKVLIAWRNLSLFETQSSLLGQTSQHTILNNVNGHFCCGTLNALMGTSGAGKTSLLKVLNGQCTNRLNLETKFYLSKFIKIKTCFITQEVSGHLMPGLTVRQTLIFASKLKNPDYQDSNGKWITVDHERISANLLEELGLKDTRDTKVEQCSGGERKRIALAMELASLQMPNLVCIDEPTSGLDSNSAKIVTSCLRNLTKVHNITIVASIHQPNTEILMMFDKLYVLALGGVCIYSGPPDRVKQKLMALSGEFNSDVKFPIEHLISHSCAGSESETIQCLVKSHDEQELGNDETIRNETYLAPDGVSQNRQRFSFRSVDILLQRYLCYFLGYLWKYSLFYYTNYIFYALFLKLFFDFKMVELTGCVDLSDGAQSRCGSQAETTHNLFLMMDNLRYTHFFSVFYLTFIYLQSAFDYQRELIYFFNEHRNGWYSTGSYYLVKCVTEIVPLILINLIYIYICNHYEVVRPGIYWDLFLVLTLSSIGFQGLAHIFALITRGNIPILTVLSITISLFAVLLDDYLILNYRLHYIYQFLSYLSIPRFCYEALIMLQYGFGRCMPGQIQAMFYIMRISDQDIYHCISMLMLNLVFYRAVAMYLLVARANPVRESRHQRAQRLLKSLNSLRPTRGIIPGVSFSYEFRIKVAE